MDLSRFLGVVCISGFYMDPHGTDLDQETWNHPGASFLTSFSSSHSSLLEGSEENRAVGGIHKLLHAKGTWRVEEMDFFLVSRDEQEGTKYFLILLLALRRWGARNKKGGAIWFSPLECDQKSRESSPFYS